MGCTDPLALGSAFFGFVAGVFGVGVWVLGLAEARLM